MRIKIKEKSLLAKLSARKLGTANVAITIGNTIFLYGATKEELLQNQSWLRHELKHVEQSLRFGLPTFLILYLLESIRKGYKENRFEIEARNAEKEKSLLEMFVANPTRANLATTLF